jgi:hypothetical protein
MASGGWSNIFLQLMVGPAPGIPGVPLPVIGEGHLELPWKTQIELVRFGWSMDFKLEDPVAKDSGGLLGQAKAVGGMAVGAGAGIAAGLAGGGGPGTQTGLAIAAAAAATAQALKDMGKKIPMIRLGLLTMTKRFDIASSRIHSAVDADLPIVSALISVLHIKQGSNSIHEPGFTLLAMDGHFEKVDIKMEKGDKGVEVMEELELRFKQIVVTYSKRLGDHDVPMPPFIYRGPKDPTSGPSLPF